VPPHRRRSFAQACRCFDSQRWQRRYSSGAEFFFSRWCFCNSIRALCFTIIRVGTS
jgi:hypothetical protein